MARAIWKGSISFGLVNIPVELYAGESRQEVHLHLLDSRNHSRVRYVRVNEETGEEVPWDAIVRGYEYESGKYVLLSEDELAQVKPEVTRSVEIEDFVEVREIEPVFFEKPYFLVPQAKQRSAFKGYALLRETLRQTGKVGIARVVIRSREYLCALMVRGEMMVLNVLRYAEELREAGAHHLPGSDLEAFNISPKEVKLAAQLVEAMSGAWEPERYVDSYRTALMEWIERKIALQDFGVSTAPAGEEPLEKKGKVVDLMEYLKRSVEEATEGRKAAGRKRGEPAGAAPSGKGSTAGSKPRSAKKKPAQTRKAG